MNGTANQLDIMTEIERINQQDEAEAAFEHTDNPLPWEPGYEE